MKLKSNKFKVYIAKLKRKSGVPRTVLKVGITSSVDALDRLRYCKADEPFPIISEFEDIKIMDSVVMESKEKAEEVEKELMTVIAGKNRFHNWFEPKKLSGITEMRVWDYNEFILGIKTLEKYKCLSN